MFAPVLIWANDFAEQLCSKDSITLGKLVHSQSGDRILKEFRLGRPRAGHRKTEQAPIVTGSPISLRITHRRLRAVTSAGSGAEPRTSCLEDFLRAAFGFGFLIPCSRLVSKLLRELEVLAVASAAADASAAGLDLSSGSVGTDVAAAGLLKVLNLIFNFTFLALDGLGPGVG